MRPLIPLLALILLTVTSCHTLKIQSPPETYKEQTIAPVYSDINIPVEIEMNRVERMINDQFKGVIYQDTSYENNGRDDIKITAWKAGDFKIFMEGNVISYEIPLNLWIKKRTVIGALGYKYTDEREITAGIDLKFKTAVSVRKDWSISTLTTSLGYEWTKQPAVKIGPVSFPLGFIADMIISANQKIINKDIDRLLSSVLDIRKMITTIWTGIQEPFKIEGDYPLWVKIVPEQIRLVSPQATDGKLVLCAGIRATTKLFYNETAPLREPEKPLPEILFTSKLDDQSSINIITEIPFNHLNELANKMMQGYTLKQGKYTVTVDKLLLFGNGDNLVVAADVSGSVKGTIYLTGKPYFDKHSKTFKIQDLDFDVKTRNVLVKSARWMFHNGLVEAFQSKMEFPVAYQLDEIRGQLQKLLNDNEKIGMFRFSGTISNVDIGDIYITRNAVKGLFQFEGKAGVSLLK